MRNPISYRQTNPERRTSPSGPTPIPSPMRSLPGIAALGLCISVLWPALSTQAQTAPRFRVLYYGKSPAGAAYVHTAEMAAFKDTIVVWGKAYGFAVDVAADATVMTKENLAKYQTVVFDNIPSETSDALPQASQRAALLEYMKTGGFVGNHATSEASRWTEFVALLGAKMANHTNENTMATATENVDPAAANHPVVTGMAGAPAKFELAAKVVLADEWYTFTTNPRSLPGVKILYTLDEKTFTPAGSMGADHPITWVRDMTGGGRLFYTGSGHHAPFLAQPFIRSMLLNAIFWTAKQDVNTAARSWTIAPIRGDGRVRLHAEADGPLSLLVKTGRGGLELRALDGRFQGDLQSKGDATWPY
jgi:type 1 glutamine amidotransferase